MPDAVLITPREPAEAARNCRVQSRRRFTRDCALAEGSDVVADVRAPDLSPNLAPVPMYCSFEDVVRTVDALRQTA